MVLVLSCDAGTAGGDGCKETAVALAGNTQGKGALAGTATAGKLLSADKQQKRGWAGWEP